MAIPKINHFKLTMANTSVQEQLTATLLDQVFVHDEQKDAMLHEYKKLAGAYINIDHSIAVLSDFQADKSYIYVGSFGKIFGMESGNIVIDSAFEECIFSKIHPDDLTERHILELSYFRYLKKQPVQEREKYSTFSRIRACNTVGDYCYVNHRNIYLKTLPNDGVWLALCTYAPSADVSLRPGIDGKIVNNETGEVISFENYKDYGQGLLSKRETEVLTHVAKGMGSKQIAEQLNIAVHTVRRHRQNIIHKMQVANTAEAVKTCIVMGIITI